MVRARLCSAALVFWVIATQPLVAMTDWPLWESYTSAFLESSGRIIDHDASDRTTSEGQAYALFFSLIANDRSRFDRILAWTQDNLAHRDIGTHLPAWLWSGQEGRWKVADENSASDADLWIAYTLLEAGRHWQDPKLATLGDRLATLILQKEVSDIPGLGLMLLPGAIGFKTADGWYQLNASYLPVQPLLGIATHTGDARWRQIADLVPKVVEGSCAKGFILDWIAYRSDEGFSTQPAPVSPLLGSYDAIRVYLWAGMLAHATPGRERIWRAGSAMVTYLDQHHFPPVGVSESGQVIDGRGNPGFSAALVPLLIALNKSKDVEQLRLHLNSEKNDKVGLYGNPPRYYDQNLALFALGWCDKRFHFDEQGRLRVNWK